MEAISLASTIVQFTHVGLEFFSRFFALCRSANGTLEEISAQEQQLQKLLQHITDLEALSPTENRSDDAAACRKIISDLLHMVDSTKGNGNGKQRVVSNLRAAARAIRIKHQVEKLNRGLDSSMKGLRLSADIQQIQGLQSLCDQMESLTTLLKQPLEVTHSQKPKDLGYPWETGALEEHIRIGDGLGKEYYLPLDFCSSHKEFLQLLVFKFESRQLPGLALVREAHLELGSWDGRTKLDNDTWDIHLTSGRGIKASFIMSVCMGFDHWKCIRCGETQTQNIYRRTYSTCSRCQLQFRWVDPDDILYETHDATFIPFRGEVPDDPIPRESAQQGHSKSMPPRENIGTKTRRIGIEHVCHRLTMKWEPVLNYTHRYLFCRCIARKSTPSSFTPEATLPIYGVCPRHNKRGKTHSDYGYQNYHQGPYFELFGGYNAFRGMVLCFFPAVYLNCLNRRAFIAEDELDVAMDDFCSASDRLGSSLEDDVKEYMFELYDYAQVKGFELPEHVLEFLSKRKKDQRKSEVASILDEAAVKEFWDCPMMQEVTEILNGRWSGKPHWAVGS